MKNKDLPIYKKLIEIGQISKPNYKTWSSRDFWAPIDAACLFNGVDPDFSCRIKTDRHEDMKFTIKTVCIFSDDEASTYNLSTYEITAANAFLKSILEESRAIETWKKTWLFPLELINRYLGTIGNIPQELLRVAKRLFLGLYTIRNDHSDTKAYWDEYWHNNISIPFLRLIVANNASIKKEDQEPTKIDQKLNTALLEECNNGKKAAIKIILDESTEARETRIRNRGYEVYKLLKEQCPNKKITKEVIAEQIMNEEESLYKLVAAKNPLKKQPALGTYLKELRKTH